MKMLSAKAKISGLTLIEVLVVIFVIAFLFMMLLPGNRPKQRAPTVMCLNNQKQIALGFVMFNDDNYHQFPWQLSQTNNGVREKKISNGHASEQFQPIWDYTKNLRIFICPIDKAKITATNIANFSDSNLSYFANVDSSMTNAAANILSGDRYLLANDQTVGAGLFNYLTNQTMSWSKESHNGKANLSGILSFTDGHAEIIRSTNLNSIFQREGMATDRLIVP
jgi:Prokaryotic N-terminal methylation motif